jgi:hypothetical protein
MLAIVASEIYVSYCEIARCHSPGDYIFADYLIQVNHFYESLNKTIDVILSLLERLAFIMLWP